MRQKMAAKMNWSFGVMVDPFISNTGFPSRLAASCTSVQQSLSLGGDGSHGNVRRARPAFHLDSKIEAFGDGDGSWILKLSQAPRAAANTPARVLKDLLRITPTTDLLSTGRRNVNQIKAEMKPTMAVKMSSSFGDIVSFLLR
jgi:hypothetical protein